MDIFGLWWTTLKVLHILLGLVKERCQSLRIVRVLLWWNKWIWYCFREKGRRRIRSCWGMRLRHHDKWVPWRLVTHQFLTNCLNFWPFLSYYAFFLLYPLLSLFYPSIYFPLFLQLFILLIKRFKWLLSYLTSYICFCSLLKNKILKFN